MARASERVVEPDPELGSALEPDTYTQIEDGDGTAEAQQSADRVKLPPEE